MKKYIFAIIFAMVAVVLAGCGSEKAEKPEPVEVEISDDELVADEKVVAVIDGEEIKGAFYNTMYLQEKSRNVHTGEFKEDEIKDVTMERIIDEILMLHLGKEIGRAHV